MSKIRARIRTLEIRHINGPSSCVFTRRTDGDLIAAIWARGDGHWPSDQEFDPPIPQDDLPVEWMTVLARCDQPPVCFSLNGVFGGYEVAHG